MKFPTTAQRRRGLGPVKKGNAYGLLVHSMIAVDAESGACLGLVGGQIWTRPGVNPIPHRERPLEERESMRWLDAAEQAKQVLQPAAMVTVVDDRESDIYAKWASVPDAGFHMLTRAMKDRRLAGGGMLFAAAGSFPAGRAAQHQICRPAIPASPSAPRWWRCAMARWRSAARTHEPDRSLSRTVRLRLVEVKRGRSAGGCGAAALAAADDARDRRRGRGMADRRLVPARWVIEQLHRVMKSQGLQLEDSQVDTAERLEKLAAAAVKAACIDIQLTQERDGKHQLPGATVFTEPEMETIEALVPTLEGKTERQKNPHPVEAALARAGWVVARLGGWNCYYKPPGPITFRRGMERFYAIHHGRMLEMRLQRDCAFRSIVIANSGRS